MTRHTLLTLVTFVSAAVGGIAGYLSL